MRITKKLLRETKRGLDRRIGELSVMDDAKLAEEHKRCFPHRTDEQRPAFVIGLRKELMLDCIELCIPSHWCE